ncbi:DYTN [Bugula neritina]|uniref:DYTN n=1 Tax=Bugula neritina TaxID=10212 RepID=A0A7J7JEB1_BUGNE|nr:DYTN [Bugula neritina]
MNKWEKCYSRSGCPYYLNFRTMRSQWEHPYFAQVLTEAADYNDVIYAAYRTALKLLHIRNNHHLQSLDVDKISNAFSETSLCTASE